MTSDQRETDPNPTSARSAWRSLRDRYRRLSDTKRRILRIAMKTVVVIYVLGAAMYLTTRYVLWPRVENYKTEIEQAATQAIGKPVSVKTMQATWEGFNPRLVLDEVTVQDAEAKPLIVLPQVSATLSWASLPAMSVRFKLLEISRPDLDIQRDADGNIRIAGILFDSAAEDDSDGAQWALVQDEIRIRDGRVRWQDDMREAPALLLDDVNVTLQNGWWSHQFQLTAKPPSSLAAPFEVSADFRHPFFASDISDFRQWKGELYADLRNTDLAAWKPYFDYPMEIYQGYGSVRAWLTLDHLRVADFTADLSLKDVATRLRKDLEPLNLIEVSGRISARENAARRQSDGKISFGEYGHSVELKNISLKTKEGLVLPETTITEEYTPGMYGEPSRTAIWVQQLDLDTIAKFMRYIPMTAEQRKILVELAPTGQLKEFRMRWEGSYPNLVSYQVGGEFIGLSVKPQRSSSSAADGTASPGVGQPGFENLTGRIQANQFGGSLELNAENAVLQFPGIFSDPAMKFEVLKLQANWAVQEKQKKLEVSIADANFVHDGMAGSVNGKYARPLDGQDSSPGTLQLTGQLSGMDVKKVSRYLPLQTSAGLRQWLSGALEEGMARDVQFRLKGNLADFPFAEEPGVASKGEFFVSAGIENGKLNYTPGERAPDGVSPQWPQAEKIQGRITVRGARMEISATSAQTANVALTNVLAVIPDLRSKDQQVVITGQASGALQDFVRYTQVTPVAGWIDHFTDETRAIGNARLDLKMQLMLDRMGDSKVQGMLAFDGNDVALMKELPLLSRTKGKFEFYEKGFRLHDISADFLGGQATIAGGTQADGKFQIKADGNLTVDSVRKEFPSIPHRISGKTDYSVTITQKGRLPDILVVSSLRGLALDFPVPLKKKESESLPLKVHLTDQSPIGNGPLRDQIEVTLGQAVTARYYRQRSPGKGAAWHVLRGGIGVNAPPPEPASGVSMRLVMGAIDADALKAQSAAMGGGGSSASGSGGMLQYFTPTSFQIKTPKLTMSGFQLDQVDMQVERRQGGLQIGIKSQQATGSVSLTDDPKEGHSKVVARLSMLSLASSSVPAASDVLEAPDKPTRLPDLEIVADNFEIYGKKLGRLELAAANVPGTAGRRWNISKLVIDNPGGTLTASGRWMARKSANKTTMKYSLKLKNAGELLDRLGFVGVLRNGHGKMEGTLQWEGTPFGMDKPSLSGKTTLSLKKGQFLQAEPGVAKLLNVLNLQSVPRRLLLDFRDVFSQGFAFDSVTATAEMAKGIVKTNNLKMRGIGATVLMEGWANLVKETQDLHVVVMPKLDASAASIAAMAVNPVIGVGTFLAQALLKNPLMKAMTNEYHITGTWAEPNVDKIARTERSDAESSLISVPWDN